jgi:hypothetical protein
LSNLAYKFVLQDSGGATQWTVDQVLGNYLSASDIGLLLFPRTAAEISSGVTPTSYAYIPGDVRRYGADPTGAADSYTAFANAALVGGRIFSGIPGSYKLGTTWNPNLDLIDIDLGGSTITTSLGSGTVIQIGKDEAGAAKQNVTLKNFKLNVNTTAVDGITFPKGQNVIAENIWVIKAGKAFRYVTNNSSQRRVLAMTLRNCYTTQSTIGYSFEAPNPQSTSFDCFQMINCTSEADATGVSITGALGIASPWSGQRNRLSIIGGEFQASTATGISTDYAAVNMNGVYVEAVGSDITLANYSRLIAENCSIVSQTIDSTSSLIAENCAVNELGVGVSKHVIGSGDSDNFTWGPPNFPTGASKPGQTSKVGFAYKDKAGNTWRCVVAGSTASGPPYVKYMPDDGVIIIPMLYGDFLNGNLLWFPQQGWVTTEIALIVTTTFASGTNISIGGNAAQVKYVSAVQGALANLTSGAYLSSASNADGTAALLNGKGVYWAGNEYNAASGTVADNGLYIYKSGTFTAGAAQLVIRGYKARA